MKRTSLCLALICAVAWTVGADDEPQQADPRADADAPEMPSFPPPTEHHDWLKRFEGEWVSKGKMEAEGAPVMEASVKSEMIGGFFVVNTMKGEIGPGMTFTAVQTIGYDTGKGKYIGTWVDSNFAHMWSYEGEVDAAGKKLALVTEGPDFMTGGGTAQYRDSYEFKSDDHILVTSEMRRGEGDWTVFMRGEMRRSKPNAAEQPAKADE